MFDAKGWDVAAVMAEQTVEQRLAALESEVGRLRGLLERERNMREFLEAEVEGHAEIQNQLLLRLGAGFAAFGDLRELGEFTSKS